MTKNLSSSAILLIGYTCIVFCSRSLAAEKRQLDSHEHGVSTLKIALEKNIFEMELESPADDIVGVEHAPENEKQKSQINKALAIFKDKKSMFMPSPAASCKITGHSAEFEIDDPAGHAGFHVKWQMSCSHPEKIATLATSFFKSFPKAEEIEVEIISVVGQKAIEWENTNNQIKLPVSAQ